MSLPRFGVWAGRALSLIALAFVAWRLFEQANPFTALSGGATFAAAFAVILANLAALGAHAVLWAASLAFIGQRRSPSWTARVLARTNLAKYLPGNVFHYVGRAAVARADGISLPDVTRSIALETILAALVSLALGIPAAVSMLRRLEVTLLSTVPRGATIVWISVATLLGLAALLAIRSRRADLGAVGGAPVATLARGTVASALGYLVTGATGFWFAKSLGALPPGASSALGFVSASALAWLAGFVVPGAPGGLGVREAVLLLYLEAHAPGARLGALVTLALRLLSVVADLLAAALGHVLPDRSPRS